MKEIYTYLLNRLHLTDEHEKELKDKRGFTEKTIKENRFVSGGQYVLDFEKELMEKFSEQELVNSGIFEKITKDIQMSKVLTEDRIIIPYLDENNDAYLLRPHKLGLKNVQVEIYQEKNLNDKCLIITEGEFKAAAGVQLGFATVALPGIASFSGKNFGKLTKALHKHKVRDICLIFDNEVKDDPTFSNYKENPMKRYDTQFYAYYMARILEKEGFVCRIGHLPDGWRVDGKIDIDGALAQGRTKEDMANVIKSSYNYKAYVEELSEEAQKVIKRKNAKKYMRSHIRVDFGRYVATRFLGKDNIVDEVISNFTIKMIATHNVQGKIIRDVCFVNEFNERSKVFSIESADMVRPDSFSTFCLDKGNFVWEGNKADLNNIWKSEFFEDDGRYIEEPDHVGYLEDEKLWVFGNVCIDRDGKQIRPDSNKVFWFNSKGIKPSPLIITDGKSNISEGIPELSFQGIDIKDVQQKLSDTIGETETNICLGWVTSVFFIKEVFKNYGCFPFLFLTGKHSSGKSTIAEWLMNIFGLENSANAISQTTSVAIQRSLSFYSSLPIFLDEYRNSKDIIYKTGFLRNAYNFQSSGKGVKSSFGLRGAKVRGTIIVAGEETPNDNALLSRSILVHVSRNKRKTNHYNWFIQNRSKLSNHALNIIINRSGSLERFLSVLHEGKDYLTKKGADDRTALNYAAVSAGYAVAFGESLDFAKQIIEESKRIKEEYQSENALSNFLDELQAMLHSKKINDNYWTVEDGKIYFYFNALYLIWAESCTRRGIDPFKSASIRDYFKDESGFLDAGALKRINGKACRCMVFDYESAPEKLKELVGFQEMSNV